MCSIIRRTEYLGILDVRRYVVGGIKRIKKSIPCSTTCTWKYRCWSGTSPLSSSPSPCTRPCTSSTSTMEVKWTGRVGGIEICLLLLICWRSWPCFCCVWTFYWGNWCWHRGKAMLIGMVTGTQRMSCGGRLDLFCKFCRENFCPAIFRFRDVEYMGIEYEHDQWGLG